MRAIIKIGNVIFVKSDESDSSIELYRAEIAGHGYLLKIDRTLKPPYYELFYWWIEGKREWHKKIYATSTFQKILDYKLPEEDGK